MLKSFTFKDKRLGLRFVGRKGNVVVREVLCGNEGERVGVRAGDVVIKVNGETPKNEREAMRKMNTGRPVTIMFRRESSDEESNTTLQYWKVVWRGDLNLRRLPSPRAEIVGIARFGDIFLSSGRRRGNWICVANKNELGESWILSKSNDEIYMCETTTSSENQVFVSEEVTQVTLLPSPSTTPEKKTEQDIESHHPSLNTTASPTSLEQFGYGGYETLSMYREYSYQIKQLQDKERRRKESIEKKNIERRKRKREKEQKERERVQKILQVNAQERSTILEIFHDRKISGDKKRKRQKVAPTTKNSTTERKKSNRSYDDSNLHSVRSNPWIQQERNSSKLKF